MKKLLYLFLAITIISCGGDDDGNAPLDYLGTYRGDIIVYLNGNYQGVYLQLYPITGDVLPVGYEFKSDDFCTVSNNSAICNKEQLELYASSTLFADVYEEIDSDRYFLEITLQNFTSTYEFLRLSGTSIKQILPTGETTYILQ